MSSLKSFCLSVRAELPCFPGTGHTFTLAITARTELEAIQIAQRRRLTVLAVI
jgi:hypothetical protein